MRVAYGHGRGIRCRRRLLCGKARGCGEQTKDGSGGSRAGREHHGNVLDGAAGRTRTLPGAVRCRAGATPSIIVLAQATVKWVCHVPHPAQPDGSARMMLLYTGAVALALLLSAPVWGWRMLRQGRYREGLAQRLGIIPQRLQEAAWMHRVIWVHAVSVGEVLAASRLIQSLQEALPHYSIVLSTTTPTGQAVARERFGADRVFYYPLDLSSPVRRYLRALQPELLILMESELWPRMLVECERARVPVAVVNARVSDRSLPRYLALRALWKPLLAKVSLLLAQTPEDAARWVRIGATPERVSTPGNLKYDVTVDANSPLVTLLQRHLPNKAKVIVCGSTHAGEEELLLQCFAQMQQAGPVLVLAPRHPQRSGEVEALVTAANLSCLALSQWRLAPEPITTGTVLLVDTVGELAPLYSLAAVAFVGGSLVQQGGHNPLEAAQFSVPVVMGPHFENFRSMVDAMRSADAIVITEPQSLCASLQAAIRNQSDVGARARSFYESQAGATARTVQALLTLLPEEWP